MALTLLVSSAERGPGIWKFNESVLKDEKYIDLVKKRIKDTVSEYAIPLYTEEFVTNIDNFPEVQFNIGDSLFYETLLMLIRGDTIQYCKRKVFHFSLKTQVLVELGKHSMHADRFLK